MRVLEVREPFGIDALAFSTRPIPDPGPQDVLIRLQALSLNYRDRLVIAGFDRWRPAGPRIPVSDGVGEVVSTGAEVSRVRAGDRVIPIFYPRWIDGSPATRKMVGALGGAVTDGLYTEYALVDQSSVVIAPSHLSDEEAATLPCAALTAWNAVAERTRVREGDTVVVLGTGGVGLFAVQFAYAFGARVVVTSSSDAKLARARELVAAAGINYRSATDWPKVVRDLTDGEGADLVVDTAGSLAQAVDAVRVGGTIAFIGLLAGTHADVDLVQLMGKSATIRAIDVGSRATFESMNAFIGSLALRPVVDRVFAFDDPHQAIRYLAGGTHFGKICVRV
jgi:NADPH:quinone reductase-like Zn-dependent oxidoreductase